MFDLEIERSGAYCDEIVKRVAFGELGRHCVSAQRFLYLSRVAWFARHSTAAIRS
jgi:hypothetical protein